MPWTTRGWTPRPTKSRTSATVIPRPTVNLDSQGRQSKENEVSTDIEAVLTGGVVQHSHEALTRAGKSFDAVEKLFGFGGQ
jgi:hypothetical protein